MANNSRVSRSASLEDLREKNSQMEVELSKLADEVKEITKKQDESSRKQKESQRRMEETSRALDDKLSNLGLMMERTLRQLNGKGPNFNCGEHSNSNGVNKENIDGTSRNQGNGDKVDVDFDLNSEELHWTESNLRNRERVVRPDNKRSVQLPRMDFPQFDGNDPKMWQLNCEFYFEIFEVPEVYKTRMVVMNFSEEIYEWYRGLTIGMQQLPWDLLVEEVMARFLNHTVRNPVDEFKRVHQIGKVEEFIKKFDRTRIRLLQEKPAFDEGFFVAGFVSGLKEELRHTVELFNPRGLNQTYQCALKVEAAYETQNRKPKDGGKMFKHQKYPQDKPKPENGKPDWRQNSSQKSWQQRNNNQPNYTYEQRRELGLCHKCNGKYFPGHQCTSKMMKLEVDSDSEKEDSEEEHEHDEHKEELGEEVEQAMISMFTGSEKKKMNSMKFKGYIGELPICALLDSGSTHSFINPELIKKLELPTIQANPMVVRVANG